jgi:DNA-binding PadR family transcriptional regulator
MSSHDLNATAASLLGFLHEGPKTGWDLAESVEGSVGYFWNITRSQVYRELKTLAAAGLVAEKRAGARDKVPYAITAAGRAAFQGWMESPPAPDLLRLPIVLTVFFGAQVDPAVLRGHIEHATKAHRARLATYEALLPEVTEPFQRATLDLGVVYEKTIVDWLEGLPWAGGGAPKKPAKKGA